MQPRPPCLSKPQLQFRITPNGVKGFMGTGNFDSVLTIKREVGPGSGVVGPGPGNA